MTFRDRVAVITGAGSGIGAALALELARRGAHVIASDVDDSAAATTALAIRGLGRNATHARLDVTNADAVERLAAETTARHGRIDLWINNAGIAVGGATEDLELADWKRVLDVNLAGVINGVHAIYPRMVRRGSGHIVNIASVAGLAPYPLALPYVTSKRAVVGLSQALRAEARGHGVRVSVACPGMIVTPIWQRSEVRGALAGSREQLLARFGSRFGPRMTAERCAHAILRGVTANRGVIPVTVEAHLAWYLERLSPSLATWVSSRIANVARSLSAPAARAA
jgi:NAD(P)-dependent dehydrogenase (short-subunit alcohol dehydrogenase family)